MLQELESKLGVGGRGVVAEMVASPDKEQPPAVLQRERESEWGSVCIEGGVERERERKGGERNCRQQNCDQSGQ